VQGTAPSRTCILLHLYHGPTHKANDPVRAYRSVRCGNMLPSTVANRQSYKAEFVHAWCIDPPVGILRQEVQVDEVINQGRPVAVGLQVGQAQAQHKTVRVVHVVGHSGLTLTHSGQKGACCNASVHYTCDNLYCGIGRYTFRRIQLCTKEVSAAHLRPMHHMP